MKSWKKSEKCTSQVPKTHVFKWVVLSDQQSNPLEIFVFFIVFDKQKELNSHILLDGTSTI